MGSIEEPMTEFLHKYLRTLKCDFKALESKSLPADEKEEQKFILSSIIEELTEFFRVSNPPIDTVGGDHSVCCVPVSPPEQGRYLCVYFGFTVFCIDLKNKIIIDDPNQLVQIPPIQLLKKGLPVSMGMFKLNSHTYMVGGQTFEIPEHSQVSQPTYLWDLRFFKFFLKVLNGRYNYSSETYHLSMSDDTLGPFLTPCDFIGPLNKPKSWPIVERIGDKIHVFDSFPIAFVDFHSMHKPFGKEPSHEVLDCQDIGRGWVEIPLVFFPDVDGEKKMSSLMTKICNHIVVGDRIYARSEMNEESYLVFESESSKWVLCDYESQCETRDPALSVTEYFDLESKLPSIKHVSQILQYNGRARCFATSVKYAETLYVVVALFPDENLEMIAIAYLVTGRGQILLFQRLPNLFEMFAPLFEGREATLINVDEHTMFAIVHGLIAYLPEYDYDDDKNTTTVETVCEHFLLISSFIVEEVGNIEIDVESVSEDDLGKLPLAVEKVFVEVDVKDVYVYKKDMKSDRYHSYDDTDYDCVRACVL